MYILIINLREVKTVMNPKSQTYFNLRNLELDDAYDIQNENDNKDLIDETLKN